MSAGSSWPPEWPAPPSPWQPAAEPVRRVVPVVMPRVDDVGEALLARRVVMLAGPLGWPEANDAAARLMLLDGDNDADVHLYIACPDGDLGAALMLADTVDLVRGTVHAVASGTVGGAALAPYTAAGHRIALPHALFELREPRLPGEQGTATSLTDRAALLRHQSAQLHAWLVKATGQEAGHIADDLRTGVLLNAAQALAYGLVQEIVESADA